MTKTASTTFRLKARQRLLRGGVAFGLAAIGSATMAQEQPKASLAPVTGAWMDVTLSPDARAKAALAAMTQEEKLALLRTPMPMMIPPDKRAKLPVAAGHISGVPRLGIAAVAETDASLGVNNLGHMRPGDVATALPSSLALGSSWDPEIAFKGGAMIGSEARAKGFGVMLAGGVNLLRDPRAGRNFEYVSEDPLLSGVLGGKAIAGVQSNRIVSTIKHFAVNNQETGRNVYSVQMDEAPMRESELLAFEIANEIGQPGSVMCAYNRVNEVYACENSFLLNGVLRRDWGYRGWVMSDWGAVHSTGALLAGLDQQSGYQLDNKPYFGAELEKALAARTMPQSAVDTAAHRILRTLFAHGVVDAPPMPDGKIDYDANAQVAQAQAEAGIVLLRNEDSVLPVAATAKRIAVIGGHADIGVLSGGGSSQVVPVGGLALEVKQEGDGLLAFIKRSYGGTAPLAALKAAFPNAQVDFADGSDPAAAAALAARADFAVVFAEKWFYESADSADLNLGEGQDELIDAVASANSKTVVVLETGNPVAMPWLKKVPAVLAAWYPGQRGGEAIARILSGAVNPSGHLPLTWAASVEQLPLPKMPGSDAPPPDKAVKASYSIQADRMPFSFSYPEGSDVGYRWFDKTGAKPLYAFGHGLSYTQFAYDGLKVRGGKTITASFTVTNRGDRAGADVAQVYATAPGKAKRLIGWGRAMLAPGESRQFSVTADPRLLANFDVKKQAWVVKPGDYRVEVGMSAAEPVLTLNVKLSGQRISAKTGKAK
jgi:beta-glucosidase